MMNLFFLLEGFFIIWNQFTPVAHIASRSGTIFPIETIVSQHFGQFQMMSTDLKFFFCVIGKILNIVALSASHAEFPRDLNHFFSNFLFIRDHFRRALAMSIEKQEESQESYSKKKQ